MVETFGKELRSSGWEGRKTSGLAEGGEHSLLATFLQLDGRMVESDES